MPTCQPCRHPSSAGAGGRSTEIEGKSSVANESPRGPDLARQLNTLSVLAGVRDSPVRTATDLMATTGLSRATVHSLCTDLVRRGWLLELEPAREAGALTGRPSRRFRFHATAGYVLGVDVGDTHISVLLADLLGAEVLGRRVNLPRRRSTSGSRIGQLGDVVRAVLGTAGVAPGQVLVAGIGLAAPVSRDGRVIAFGTASSDLYWRAFQTDTASITAALGGIAPLIENDANLALLAERWRGSAQGVDDLMVVLGGERLGAGLMEGGRLLHGRLGGAGELSFLDHFLDGRSADGFAYLARTWATELIVRGRPSSLSKPGRTSPATISTKKVFAAAAAGDGVALEVLERLAARVAQIVSAASILLDPEVVIVASAVAQSLAVLREPTERHLRVLTSDPPELRYSNLGEAVVAVGAVRLALDHVERQALSISLPET